MKLLTSVFTSLIFISALADTPPPGTVKAKMYTGDGVTALTSTGAAGALDVNIKSSSGSTTVNQGTAGASAWLTSITASVLPTNACQESGGHLASIDSKLANPMPVTGTVGIGGTVPISGTVGIAGTVPVSGSITATNSANGNTGSAVPIQATQVGGSDGTDLRAFKVSSTGVLSVDGSAVTQPVSGTFWQTTQPVSAASLPLPSNAAQETGGNLASINTKTPALGQALAGASVPVVLTAAQILTLTPLTSVTVTQGTGSNLHTVIDSGTVGIAGTVPVSGTFWQTTQPVSTASLPLPSNAAQETGGNLASIVTNTTGLATSSAQSSANTSLSTIVTNTGHIPSGLTVVGSALKVDGSAVTQPVSGTVAATQSGNWNLQYNTINANAVLSARQTVTTSESNLVAPSNAVAVLVECESVNTDNLRWGFSSSTASILSSTLGMLCEPGRDSGQLPVGAGAYLHMISTGGGSDFMDVQWITTH